MGCLDAGIDVVVGQAEPVAALDPLDGVRRGGRAGAGDQHLQGLGRVHGLRVGPDLPHEPTVADTRRLGDQHREQRAHALAGQRHAVPRDPVEQAQHDYSRARGWAVAKTSRRLSTVTRV